MSILQEIRELESGPRELRKFGWLVGGILLVLGAFAAYRGKPFFPWLLAVGGALVVVGTVLPKALRPFYYAWMSLAVVLGWVMTRVILTLFFALVLTPVGLFFRLIGRDILHRKPEREKPSYWQEKTYPIADRSRYEKFF